MTSEPLKLIREFGAYGAASAIALAVDVGLLQLLTSLLQVHYLVAATVSFISGGIALYGLSVTFVFKTRRVDSRTLELSFFLALGLAGLVVNAAVMYVAVGIGHTQVIAGKLLAAGFTFSMNFVLRRFLLFSPAPRPQAIT
jgi:putative flippase GtrA